MRRVEVGEDGGWGEGVAVGRGDCVGAKVWMGHKVVRGEVLYILAALAPSADSRAARSCTAARQAAGYKH